MQNDVLLIKQNVNKMILQASRVVDLEQTFDNIQNGLDKMSLQASRVINLEKTVNNIQNGPDKMSLQASRVVNLEKTVDNITVCSGQNVTSITCYRPGENCRHHTEWSGQNETTGITCC